MLSDSQCDPQPHPWWGSLLPFRNPASYDFHTCNHLSGLPSWLSGQESACNARDTGSVPVSDRYPGEGNGNPLQYSGPGKSHGQRSLAGYSPWRHKESDMTERLNNNHLSYMYPFPVFVSKCPIKEIENTLGILNRKNFIKELIIKVFEELEKPKKKRRRENTRVLNDWWVLRRHYPP